MFFSFCFPSRFIVDAIFNAAIVFFGVVRTNARFRYGSESWDADLQSPSTARCGCCQSTNGVPTQVLTEISTIRLRNVVIPDEGSVWVTNLNFDEEFFEIYISMHFTENGAISKWKYNHVRASLENSCLLFSRIETTWNVHCTYTCTVMKKTMRKHGLFGIILQMFTFYQLPVCENVATLCNNIRMKTVWRWHQKGLAIE